MDFQSQEFTFEANSSTPSLETDNEFVQVQRDSQETERLVDLENVCCSSYNSDLSFRSDTISANSKENTHVDAMEQMKLFDKYSCGIEELPEQNKKTMSRKTCSFNIMCVGQSGLGKSTFIDTFFQTDIYGPGLLSREENEDTCGRTTRINKHTCILEEEGIRMKVCCLDTPGFGDFCNNTHSWSPIVTYINKQYTNYLLGEEQPERSLLQDHRVHVVLYFVSSSNKGLSPLDIECMRAIGECANLIPVIAKSDGLLPEDCQNLKKNVQEICKVQKIRVFKFSNNDDDPPIVDYNDLMPFSIIGSREKVLNDDKELVHGRKYLWGVSEVYNPTHCDFVHLKKLLMETHLVELIDSTNSVFYEKWRASLFTNRKQQLANPPKPTEQLKDGTTEPLEDDPMSWDPVFTFKHEEIKKKYNDKIEMHEERFKAWKQTLYDRQELFNKEIDVLHSKVKVLQKEYTGLEEKVNDTEDVLLNTLPLKRVLSKSKKQ